MPKKVLITPPEPVREVLLERVLKREKELADGAKLTPQQLEDRLIRAEFEIKYAKEHSTDLILVNDDLDTAVVEFVQYLKSLI